MEKYQPPTSDFLEIVIELCQEFQEETSTKLFVRVCLMHRGEQLIITKQMTETAMRYLVEQKIDNIAANGLLRLAFQNGISFATLSVQLLLEFQAEYNQTLLSFFKSIPMLPYQLIESLPSTCFCITSPMIQALRQQGYLLHTQVPIKFLPSFIEILCYSFTDSNEEFQKFIQTFKNGCMKHYEALLSKDFQSLLKVISDLTYSMNSLFFKKLSHQTKILERAFELLQEKKILMFDKENINNLIECNNEAYLLLKLKPKIMKESSSSVLNQIIKELIRQNEQIEFNDFSNNLILSHEDQNVSKQMNISSLLPIQQLCYKFCLFNSKKERLFIQYDTGQGKTSLCLALAAYYAKQFDHVIILNKSKYLIFRDFKKASHFIQNLEQTVILANEENINSLQQYNIIFTTLNAYFTICHENNLLNLQNCCLIVDEFDSIIFEDNKINQNGNNQLLMVKKIIAFTGSKLIDFHKFYITQIFDTKVINFTLPQTHKNEPVQHKISVFSTLKQFQKQVIVKCVQQLNKTPVVIIIDQHSCQIKNCLEKKGISVEYLIDKEEQYIESALITFNQKIRNLYQVFIVASSLGRGLDFLSNEEIEQNGGIYLIISTIPTYYLQFQQYIGRTGRIGCKDKNSKNQEGELYLNKKLQELQNIDLLNLSKFQQNIKINIQQNEEQVSKNIQLEEQKMPIQNDQRVIYDIKNLQNYDQCTLNKKESEFELTDSSQDNIINRNDNLINFKNNKLANIKVSNAINKNKRDTKYEVKNNFRQSKRIQAKYSQQMIIDEQYFQGYEDPLIHQEMLQDEIRMKAYEHTIMKVAQDKVFIDVGAGTGILSMMAAKNGAKQVYAIEYSQINQVALKNIQQNNLEQKILLIKEKAEDFYAENLKIDILISEWMGYFLIFENMLPSVLQVRDNYLKEDGIIIPSKAQLFLSAFTNNQDYQGINISFQEAKNIDIPVIDIIQENKLMTDSSIILDIDLKIDNYRSNNFESEFQLKGIKDSNINGFVAWFDVQLIENICISTSPASPATHWKQTQLFLKKQFQIKQGEQINGKIKVKPHPENYRGIIIKISYQSQSMVNQCTQNWIL